LLSVAEYEVVQTADNYFQLRHVRVQAK